MFEKWVPGVLLGCAIGDAMGMPFESYGCEIHPELEKWKGGFGDGNHHKLQAGRWTDDTEMSLELAKSMLLENRYQGKTAASHYHAWIKGNPTGTGSTTRNALAKFDIYADDDKFPLWKRTGEIFDDPEAVGSGTAMRAAPIGVMYFDMPEMLRRVCRADAYITHAHEEAYAASLAVAATVAGAIRIREFSRTSEFTWNHVWHFLERQLMVVDRTLTAKAIKKGALMAREGCTPEEFADDIAGRFGSAWQCTSTAIFCAFRGWQTFEGALQMAIRLGGDADTRAAITGAILGAKFGIEGIPLPLKNHVFKGNEIAYMDKALFEARVKRDGQDTRSSLG